MPGASIKMVWIVTPCSMRRSCSRSSANSRGVGAEAPKASKVYTKPVTPRA